MFNVIFADGRTATAKAEPDAFVAGTAKPTMHMFTVRTDPPEFSVVAKGWVKESYPQTAIVQILAENGISAWVEDL